MKTIVFLALCALVSAEAAGRTGLADSEAAGRTGLADSEAAGRTGLADSPILQLIFDCRGRQDQKCLENILSTSNFYEAVEKACSNCSFQQKFMMVSWLDAYKKGMSIEKANKLFNPNNQYFDTAFVNHST